MASEEVTEVNKILDYTKEVNSVAYRVLKEALDQELKMKEFAKWVAAEIFDDDWEYNKETFAELACRKLAKLGIVTRMGDEWELIESQEGGGINMADIELVIKIPEEDWEFIKGTDGCRWSRTIIDAIINGTPLPKGHGDLKDVSNLLTVTDIRSDGSEFTYVSYSEIEGAPTIIEADKTESEERDADSN